MSYVVANSSAVLTQVRTRNAVFVSLPLVYSKTDSLPRQAQDKRKDIQSFLDIERFTQDVAIHAAGDMAIAEMDGAGAHIFRRVELAPRNGRIISSNADAFHSSDMDTVRLTRPFFCPPWTSDLAQKRAFVETSIYPDRLGTSRGKILN
jgi:hypothetical protein